VSNDSGEGGRDLESVMDCPFKFESKK